MKYYAVTEDELRRLILNDLTLEALSSGGVDNWSWYGEALTEYVKDEYDYNPKEEGVCDAFERAADETLKLYQELKNLSFL